MTLTGHGRPALGRGGRLAITVVLVYTGAAIGVWAGLWGDNWSTIEGAMRLPPSAEHWLGTNRLGQDVFARLLAGSATAFEIGLTVALAAVGLGALIGGLAGYRPDGWIDRVAVWLISTVDAVPFYLFAAALAYALQLWPGTMQAAMMLTFWTLTARLVRTETQRLRQRGFVAAARVAGLGRLRILLRHILPHTLPILAVQFSLVFVAAIKTEVLLSFLGLGPRDSVSWGVMIAEASQEILAGHTMNFIAPSLCLFLLVFSVNRLTDRVQSGLDPRARAAPLRGMA